MPGDNKSFKNQNGSKKIDSTKKEDEEKVMECDETKNKNNERKCTEWEKVDNSKEYSSNESKEREKTQKAEQKRESLKNKSNHEDKESSRKEKEDEEEEPSKTPKGDKEREFSKNESNHKDKESCRKESEEKEKQTSKTRKEYAEKASSNGKEEQIHGASIKENENKENERYMTQKLNNYREYSKETDFSNISKNGEEQSPERKSYLDDSDYLTSSEFAKTVHRTGLAKEVKGYESPDVKDFLESIEEKIRNNIPKNKPKIPFYELVERFEHCFVFRPPLNSYASFIRSTNHSPDPPPCPQQISPTGKTTKFNKSNTPPAEHNPQSRYPKPTNPKYFPNPLDSEPMSTRIQNYLQQLEQRYLPNERSLNARLQSLRLVPASDLITIGCYDNRREILKKMRELLPGKLSNAPDSVVLHNCIFYLQIFDEFYQQFLDSGPEPVENVLSRRSIQNFIERNPEEFDLSELQTLLNILVTYENIRRLIAKTRQMYKNLKK